MNCKQLKKALFSAFFIASNIAPIIHAESIDYPDSCPQLKDFPPSLINSSKLAWIADGDTFHTKEGHKIRLLHIDAPELNSRSNKPAEAFAHAAKTKLNQLIGNSKKIYWINDVNPKDKYNRELALVFNQSGQLINAGLVANGLAHSLIILPNQNFWRCISDAQTIAVNKKSNIWSTSAYQLKIPAQVKPNQGIQLIQGHITKIINTSKYRWILMDRHLWIKIPRENLIYFEDQHLLLEQGKDLTVIGYVYRSHNQLRLTLYHPSMLIYPEKLTPNDINPK